MVGIVITLAGFLLSVISLGMTSSVGARMVLVLAGIVVSMTGIIGFVGRSFVKEAIWKR
ncbi:MAG: hypothetical protein U0Q16_18515 [Bryobacteraceae bacterium]